MSPRQLALRACLPVALALAACAAQIVPTPTGSPAPDWAEPAAYRFTYRTSCGFRPHGTYRVEVTDGAVVEAMRVVGSGGAGPVELAAVHSLGRILALADEAQGKSSAEVRVELDPADGHPTLVDIDWMVEAIDDEECFEISDYEVLAP